MDLQEQLKQYCNLPNIDGEGFLFAFSGMDGETNHASSFVLPYIIDVWRRLLHTLQGS